MCYVPRSTLLGLLGRASAYLLPEDLHWRSDSPHLGYNTSKQQVLHVCVRDTFYITACPHILISYFSLQFDMTRITVRYNQFFTQLGVSQHNSFSCMKSFCYSIRWQPVPNHRSFLNTHYPTHYCVAEPMFRSSVTRIASCSTLSNGVKTNRWTSFLAQSTSIPP